MTVQIAKTGRANFLWRGRSKGNRGKDGGKEKHSTLERLVLPTIGDRPIASIIADDLGAIIADFMQKHPDGGGANRLHAPIARLWRWLAFHPTGQQA